VNACGEPNGESNWCTGCSITDVEGRDTGWSITLAEAFSYIVAKYWGRGISQFTIQGVHFLWLRGITVTVQGNHTTGQIRGLKEFITQGGSFVMLIEWYHNIGWSITRVDGYHNTGWSITRVVVQVQVQTTRDHTRSLSYRAGTRWESAPCSYRSCYRPLWSAPRTARAPVDPPWLAGPGILSPWRPWPDTSWIPFCCLFLVLTVCNT